MQCADEIQIVAEKQALAEKLLAAGRYDGRTSGQRNEVVFPEPVLRYKSLILSKGAVIDGRNKTVQDGRHALPVK